VELRDGDRLVAWFGRAAEGKRDVAIWEVRLTSDQLRITYTWNGTRIRYVRFPLPEAPRRTEKPQSP
jgi:predicted neuraminidase